MTLPSDIAALLERAQPDFRGVASFATDINRDGRLTAEWLVVGTAGVAQIGDGEVTVLAREEIDALATRPYLSGGRLTARRNGETHLLARYSGARLAAAEAFARTANRVLQAPGGSTAPDAPAPNRAQQTPAPEQDARHPEEQTPAPEHDAAHTEVPAGRGPQPATAAAAATAQPAAERDPVLSGRVLPRLFAMLPASKHWRVPVIALALAAAATATVLSPLLAGRFLFDEVLAPGGRFAGQLLLAVGLILLVRVAEVGFNITWGWTNAAFIHDLEITLKRAAFGSLQRLSLRFYSGRHTGEMMTRLEQDASDIALLFHIIAPSALRGGLFLVGSLIAMLLLDWQLALAAILPFPLLFIVFRRIIPEVNSYFERMFRAEAELRTVTSDSLTGARVVRAFGQQRRELERFAGPNRTAARLGYLADAMVGTTTPPMQLVTELVLVGVWAAGAWAVARDQVTVGLLVTFAAYLAGFFWPVGGLVELAQDWGRVATAARRLLALIDARPDVPPPLRPQRIDRLRGGLALEQVSFSYAPGQPALREVSLHAAAGEMIGLVGPTGAGKSTVINLIARLYDADEGVVRLAGHDVRTLAAADLRGQIGIVLQDTYLFLGSVADNIAYAKPDADREQIVAAAMAANAHHFIVALPDGYDTELGPGGYGLSGGQRQRLAIARALLLDPPILLMDEATSSVDTETEVRIQAAIERVVHGRTVVVIAHRLSTLRLASRLYVLHQGRVVESGPHAELMGGGGFYQSLVERQREALHVIGVGE